jgi:hypothetical protein
MNTHSRTYAGRYKITAVLSLVDSFLFIMYLSPSIFGRSARPDGISLDEGVCFVLSVICAAQAVKYRSVKSSEEDEMEK